MVGAVPAAYVRHTRDAIVGATPVGEPFRHLVIENFLHPDLYRALDALDLGDRLPARHATRPTHSSETLRFAIRVHPSVDWSTFAGTPLPALWATLTNAHVQNALIKAFAAEIVKRHGRQQLRVSHAFEIIEDRSGYALPPHTDTYHKLVTALIYLPEPGADEGLGTSIYTLADEARLPDRYSDNTRFDRSLFSIARTIPYRPNTALIFAPGRNTFHGVEPVDAGISRRLIQFQINRIMVDEPVEPAAS